MLVASLERSAIESEAYSLATAMFESWAMGIESERSFWLHWFETKGLQWPQDYAERMDPKHEVDGRIAEILRGQRDDGGLRILDVGAGPLTALGKAISGVGVDIVAIDPLAPLYDEILDRMAIKPIVRSRFAAAEALSFFFDSASFDLVHCRNALDHAIDPLRGIVEMLRVVKVGGSIVLRHARNEAERESYSGFHQYNFDVIDERFIIWNQAKNVVVEESIPIPAELSHMVTSRSIDTRIVKLGEFSDVNSVERRDALVRCLLERIVMHLVAGKGNAK